MEKFSVFVLFNRTIGTPRKCRIALSGVLALFENYGGNEHYTTVVLNNLSLDVVGSLDEVCSRLGFAT